MERHHIDEHAAFDQLRNYSRRTNTKLVDVAQAVSKTHLLLPREPDTAYPADQQAP
jgi:AmiR/NasT family two-component response regulator